MTVDQSMPVQARFDALGPARIDKIVRRFPVPKDVVATLRLFSLVLPFRVNEYVLSELIDWSDVPGDPMFQLVFPNEGMLPERDELDLAAAAESGSRVRLAEVVARVRRTMNPHPSGQRELNVPMLGQQPVAGLQHKYDQTVLYFPQHGQTCHAYCTYCFRWAQFVGDPDLRFAAKDPSELVSYLRTHPGVTDVLVTGGDPMVMSTARLRRHIEPILTVGSVRTIRIGTKSVAYWPQRFVSDSDADDALRLYEQVVRSGRTLAVMGHYTHPRELATSVAREAVARIGSTGARLFCQTPVVAHVNDDAVTLTQLWNAEFQAGAVPYYLFVARDTGPYNYFKVPLARAHQLFTAAYRALPGLARTVRGPVMSATPGKIVVDGTVRVGDDHAFQLRFLQARDQSLAGRPFLAEYDPDAAWLDDLRPLPDVPADILTALRSGHLERRADS